MPGAPGTGEIRRPPGAAPSALAAVPARGVLPGAPAALAATVLAAASVAGSPGPAAAQEGRSPTEGQEAVSLEAALQRHRHPLSMRDGRLTGPGADLLLREAAAARHLLVGETHGVAEVPALVADLFRRLQDDGYRHLAVEIGPVQASRLNEVLSGADPMAGLRAFLRDHWPGVPFYSWREEAELLAAAVEAAGGEGGSEVAGGEPAPAAGAGGSGGHAREGPGVIWGLDYDILGDRYPLHRLLEIAPDDAARAATGRAVALADSLLEKATGAGDLSATMMFSGPDSVWAALREAYDPAAGSEADRILEQLESTSRINRAWTSGRRLESNRLRVELIKRNFHRQMDRTAPGAKVLVKMGGFHTMRGRTPNDTWDIGNHLSELAAAEGATTFHVLVLGGPGGVRGSLDPRDWGVREAPTYVERAEWGEPLAAAALEEGWTVFDLRPLRPPLSAGRLRDVPPMLEEMIFGHDVLVVIPGSTAASPLTPDGGG